MHNVSVKMNDSEYNLLDGMAKANHKSKAEVIREALQVKRAFDERERSAIMEGLKSAENEPLTSHADAIKEFAVFRENHKRIVKAAVGLCKITQGNHIPENSCCA